MKKAHLSEYGRLCQEESVIVTVNGVPAFRLAPLDEDDQLIDELIEHNPEFRKLLEERRHDRVVSVKAAMRRL